MPQFEFPYIPQPYMDTNGKLVKEYRPYVPVSLSKWRRKTLLFPALIDSGADFSLFPAQMLDILGTELEAGKKRFVYGVGDHKIITYTHNLNITVGDYTFKTKIDFSRNQHVPLLGRSGFFDKFKRISFDQKGKMMKFEY